MFKDILNIQPSTSLARYLGFVSEFDNATNLERKEKHFACVSWELIMCMEYLPVLRSEICVLRAWLGILFQTASWRPSKIDSADFPRQFAGVFQWFDVAFDVAVVFGVCQWTAMALEIDIRLWR